MDRKRLDQVFNQFQLDAIISASPQTRQWLSKVSTSDGWLIIEKNKSTLFVDGRYFEYAKLNAQNVSVELLVNDSLKQWIKNQPYKRVGIEADYLTVEELKRIKSLFNDSVEVIDINAQELRIIKSDQEIEQMQKAIDISLEAFEKVQEYISVGVSEKEIAHKIEYIMKRLGADKEAFVSIVAFGENTSKPHHHPTDRKLQQGDMVTIDFGAKYNGYCADITRTFIYGESPNLSITSKNNEILEIVEEAARRGREFVKPGIKASEVDKVCRDYISEKGYSKFFVHSTGHGLGLDVHEFPRVSHLGETILEPGMVITVEPGIYIESIGGARIEDDLLVTPNGARVLSRK